MNPARTRPMTLRRSIALAPAALASIALTFAARSGAQSAPDAGGASRSDASVTATAAGDASARPTGDASARPVGDASAPRPVEIAADPAAYTGPAPYYNLTTPRATAGLTPPSIQRLVHRQQEAMLRCYKRLLAVHPHAQGRLEVRVQVIAGGSGIVERIALTPHRNPSFEGCIREAVSAIEWANPRGVPSTTIDLGIDLAPTPPPRPGAR
jgi:hypothetical protein